MAARANKQRLWNGLVACWNWRNWRNINDGETGHALAPRMSVAVFRWVTLNVHVDANQTRAGTLTVSIPVYAAEVSAG